MTTPLRPSVFVGSSVEGIPIVEAIAVNMDYCCEVVPWMTIFEPSEYSLESLESRLDEFDFAVLVMTGDDRSESRGVSTAAPRDNVLLELGLCIGRLGRRRTIVVSERSSGIKIPSDLAGVTLAEYFPPSTGNYLSALGAPCFRIKNVVAGLGPRQKIAV